MKNTKTRNTVYSLCEAAIMIALATVFSLLRFPPFRIDLWVNGGSIDFVMVPIIILGWRRGFVGIVARPVKFAASLGIAIALNEAVYLTGIANGETFNMFFVSRHFEPSLPVYSLVQAVVPYPLCTLIYFAGFSAAAYVILLLAMAIQAICQKLQKRLVTNS